ncbi:patatin-like phospholipase family protein [Enterococcus sp. 2201sp1_2201st1_B8_2201SCRN_220225]|uniref:patatin-like phospholipase family protein n=1 Tax=unclassified Enterococcus TaxID=2608891 RepID=UPI0034A557B3
MNVKQIYPSHFIQNNLDFRQSKLVLPFFHAHSRAQEQYLVGVKSGRAYCMKALEHTLYFEVVEELRESLQVTNLLVVGEITWTTLVELLENYARTRFVKKLKLVLETTAANEEWLLKKGFDKQGEGYEKVLTYHTALVLGGGGARGGYQIGVWQALKELEIDLPIVTGTSVGALNGGLVLVGDVERGKQLWLDLSTDQVLQFPQAAESITSLATLLQQMRSLTVTALRENGASTEPLNQLIQNALDEEQMRQSSSELYVCTTHLPDFEERVVHFDKSQAKKSQDWLIASASFYPAMKAKEIAGEYYMDGGYRNNLPIDVALKKGACECILVDVKGPGFVKRWNESTKVAEIPLNSPWTLGSFLVFDRERSRINYQLGYQETMKYFGRYSGFWYTFEEKKVGQLLWQKFCRNLRHSQDPLWKLINTPDFWQKLEKDYQQPVCFETAGQVFLELAGVLLNVAPENIYQEESFVEALKTAFHAQDTPVTGALSMAEWLHLYRERLVAWSEARQLLYWWNSFTSQVKPSRRLLELTPVTAVMGAFIASLFQAE